MITKKDFIKLEGLLYLLSVMQYKSKRKVAEELNTSVDTINKYIDDLEEELGFTVLTSNGRGSVLTPEAEKILDSLNKVTNILEETASLASYKNQVSGKVRFGMTEGVSSCLFPYEIMDFYNKYPKIHIETISSDSRINMNIMEVDINISNDAPLGAELVLIAAIKLKCGLFASKSYIDAFGMPKNFDDLVNNHRICNKLNHSQYMPDWRKIIKESKNIIYSSNSTYALRAMIENGAGIGLAPQNFNVAHLVEIKFDDLEFDIPLYLIAHKETKDIPRIRVLLDYIKKMFTELK